MGESFRDLSVWQRTVQFTLEIYRLTGAFPDSERFGLTTQLRSTAVSIASNIAKGYGRATKGDYVQFLGHARAPVFELETQLVVAGGLGFGTKQKLDSAEALCCEVGRVLRATMKSIQSKTPSLVPGPQSLVPCFPQEPQS